MNVVDDMKRKFSDRNGNLFDDWWHRDGQYLDPDTDDVPWFDKRKALAQMAFEAAMAASGNYTADDAVDALQFTFANGRIVQWSETGLRIGMAEPARRYTEENCPGHVASANDRKVCRRCGVHIDSFRPDDGVP